MRDLGECHVNKELCEWAMGVGGTVKVVVSVLEKDRFLKALGYLV